MNRLDAALDWLHARRRAVWTAATVAFLLPFSLYVMLTFLHGGDFFGGTHYRSAIAAMEGNAGKPHIYRQLVPLMAHATIAVTPESVEQAATVTIIELIYNNRFISNLLASRHSGSVLPVPDGWRLYRLFIVAVIVYAFLLAYLFQLRKLAIRLFPSLFPAQMLAPVIGLLALPPFCGKFAYYYDFPVLFFSAWMTLLLLEKRVMLFTAMIAVATLNKETSLYLIALFALYGYRHLPRAQWRDHLLSQILIFLALKLSVNAYFAEHAGYALEFGLRGHLKFGVGGYSVYTLLGLGAALALFTCHWRDKPALLKHWLALLAPMGLAWLLFGNRAEYRVFYDIFPALTLLATHTFATCLGWEGKDEKSNRSARPA